MSDTELVAILLGSGSRDRDVMTLAAKVARLISGKRGDISMEMLLSIEGVGLAKAAQTLAGFELARRYLLSEAVKISQPKDLLSMLSDIMNKQQEYFVCISLNGANEIIEKRIVTVGLVDKTQVHPREVFADVIGDRAASVIIAHNHPSGELRPSENDLKVHKQLIEAGKILGIKVLEHLIVTRKGYCSLQEEGFI